ncbi:MAG: hypothetical protein H7A34_04580 [bacterium]|nr:hypothetical protein [bacterium]
MSDKRGRLSALMTLFGTLVDYKVPANVVESTVLLCQHDGSYRWDMRAITRIHKKSGETEGIVSSRAAMRQHRHGNELRRRRRDSGIDN